MKKQKMSCPQGDLKIFQRPVPLQSGDLLIIWMVLRKEWFLGNNKRFGAQFYEIHCAGAALECRIIYIQPFRSIHIA